MTEKMFEDMFGDSFGDKFNKQFDDIFGNKSNTSKQSENKDPVVNALIKTFNDEIKKGDKEFLKKAIIEHKIEVYERANNTELLEIHARAAIFVNDNKISYESLTKIISPKNKHKEALGLIAFDTGDLKKAQEYFEQVKTVHDSTRIPYVITLYENGIKDFSSHEKMLEPIREKVQLANSILGYILCDDSKYSDAEKYFKIAAHKNPTSEKTRLDLMRVWYINGRMEDIYSNMNSFFIDTESKLSHQEIEKELKERKLKVPKIKINNLYSIITDILEY